MDIVFLLYVYDIMTIEIAEQPNNINNSRFNNNTNSINTNTIEKKA